MAIVPYQADAERNKLEKVERRPKRSRVSVLRYCIAFDGNNEA